MATHSNILAWRIPMDRGAWWATVYGVAKSQTRLSDEAQHSTAVGLLKHTKNNMTISILQVEELDKPGE